MAHGNEDEGQRREELGRKRVQLGGWRKPYLFDDMVVEEDPGLKNEQIPRFLVLVTLKNNKRNDDERAAELAEEDAKHNGWLERIFEIRVIEALVTKRLN